MEAVPVWLSGGQFNLIKDFFHLNPLEEGDGLRAEWRSTIVPPPAPDDARADAGV
jgi:hypothetical protein